MFVSKPEQENNRVLKKFKNWTVSLLSGFVAQNGMFLLNAIVTNPKLLTFEYVPSFALWNNPDKSEKLVEFLTLKNQYEVAYLRSCIVAIPTSIVAYFLYNRWYKNRTCYKVARNFIIHWPEYKDVTPQELHRSFDCLYQKYSLKELDDVDIYQMIDVIQDLLKMKK